MVRENALEFIQVWYNHLAYSCPQEFPLKSLTKNTLKIFSEFFREHSTTNK